LEYVNIFQGDFIMGLGSLLGLATKLFNTGAAQQPATIQKIGVEEKPALEQVNAAVHPTNPQELNQLHAALEQKTTPNTAAITPAVLENNTLGTASKQQDFAPAVKLEISQTAVNSLRPILSALKDLVKSILPGLNLQEIAATAKPVLQALSQASSNPANTPTITANPA
jgi:hypothetical protein